MVRNIPWRILHGLQKILAMCEESLWNKIREQLIGISSLKQGGSLVLKIMIEFVMDIEDSALCSLVQSF